MLELPGYRTIERLGTNEEISLYRMLHLEDNRSVIAKTTRDKFPDATMIAAFHYEYAILGNLKGSGTLESYGLEMIADRPVMLMKDIGGSTLDHLILREHRAGGGLKMFLVFAAAIANCLAQLHREQITLYEITPFHLMVNPETLEVKFIDIRMCSCVSSKSPLSLQTGRPNSVLPYISPEQTGRTGMNPDYRSDFYSLGITLYEWLTGSLPFEPKDAGDIIYHHLASIPESVHVKYPSTPRIVSDIISKCIHKMQDRRYASAFGIKSDLEECLAQLRESGEIKFFPLASRDIPDRWSFPTSSYGRRAEQQSLLDAMQRSKDGVMEVVWIIGNGGIGKTSFVNDTLRMAAASGGFIATGKFDTNHTALPYDVWVQAFGELIDQLLTENEVRLEVWRLLSVYCEIRLPALKLCR